MTQKITEEGILTNHQQGNVQDMTETRKAENQSQADAKAPSELQVALTGKFKAETVWIDGAQTDKAQAETQLANRRAVEADAGTEKLLLEAALAEHRIVEVGANVRKLSADAEYVEGAQTDKTTAEAKLADHRVKEVDANAEKLQADAKYVSGAQTAKTTAEANLADNRLKEVDANATKLNAEAAFVHGVATEKARADANLAEAKRLEAQAEVIRLQNESLRIKADIGRVKAEKKERDANAKFTRGPRSYRERQDGHASRSIAVKNYAVPLLQAAIFFLILYFFMKYLGLGKGFLSLFS